MVKPLARDMFWNLPAGARRALFPLVLAKKHKEALRLREVSPDSRDVISLRPFFDNRCVFVHIPKSAGIAVTTSLFGCVTGSHRPLLEYQTLLTPSEFASFFKFTFVRNPWDRAVSAFQFLKDGGLTQGDVDWANKHIRPQEDFDSFVRRWMTRESVLTWRHFRPQYKYLCLSRENKPAVDFVGRFETLEADYSIVRQKLGIGSSLSKRNVTKDRKQSYQDHYTNESRYIVSQVYAEDIEMFGYAFDDSHV